MVPVQDLLGAAKVQPVVGGLRPGEVGHGLQEGPDDLRLGRLAVDPLQPPELALHLLAGLLREVQLLEALPQLLDLLALGVLAELLLDGLHLLPQEDLALPLPQLLLHLAADLLLGLQDADLALEVDRQLP